MVQAEGTVYDQFQKDSEPDNKQETEAAELPEVSVFPYILKLIGSFLLIIALLFLVQKYVIQKKRTYHGGGPFYGIAGHPLGNNRSMQLVMIGDTLYILGVGENVNLIRTIPPGEEQKLLIEAVAAAETPVDVVSNWGSQLIKKTSQKKWQWPLFQKSPEEKWKDVFLQQLKELTSKPDETETTKEKSGKGEPD